MGTFSLAVVSSSSILFVNIICYCFMVLFISPFIDIVVGCFDYSMIQYIIPNFVNWFGRHL
jgi:hypothetical protein